MGACTPVKLNQLTWRELDLHSHGLGRLKNLPFLGIPLIALRLVDELCALFLY